MKKLLFIVLLIFWGSIKSIPCYEEVDGDWVKKTLQSLSLREKIGQLFVVATASLFEQREESLSSAFFQSPYKMDHDYIEFLIKNYHIGGLIFLFKSRPDLQIDVTNKFQNMSKIPLLICQDFEWGLAMRLYDTMKFPHNMTLGAIKNKNLIYELGKEIGRQCKAIGVHVNFSPVVDVNNNKNNPVIYDRSFGEDCNLVAEDGLLMMKGLQDAGIIACAKHFPGHGDTAVDSHLDLPVIQHSRERLEKIELVPFKNLIKNGVGGVMLAHLSMPQLDKENVSSLSKVIVTDLLEKELGFTGLKFTDGMGMKALTKNYKPGEIELNAFLAGIDLLLCPLDVPKAVELIEKAILDGIVSEEDLDKRVIKILKAKEWTDCNKFVPIEKNNLDLCTPESEKLKEQLYNEAITVLGNQNVDLNRAVVVQCGGEKNCLLTRELKQCKVEIFPDIDIKDFDTVIVPIFGMNKFVAKNYGIPLEVIDFINSLNKRVVVILFGTPYSVELFKNVSDFIIAYEDDFYTQKMVSNVLNGAVAVGKSPVTIY